MHKNEIIYALICINNHVLSCLISMLSEIVSRGDMMMERIPSTDNITNLLTKPIAQNMFGRHCKCIGLMHKGDWL